MLTLILHRAMNVIFVGSSQALPSLVLVMNEFSVSAVKKDDL